MRKRSTRKKLAFFAPGTSASILVAPKRSRALFLAPWAGLGDSPGAPGTLPGRSQDDPGACRERSGWSLGASWVPWGAGETPGSDLKSILGALGTYLEVIVRDFGILIFSRFLLSSCRFCRRFSRIHSISSHKTIDEMRRETRHKDKTRDATGDEAQGKTRASGCT